MIQKIKEKIAKLLNIAEEEILIELSSNKHLIKIYLKDTLKNKNDIPYISETFFNAQKKIVARLYLDNTGYEYCDIVEILETIIENTIPEIFASMEK